MARRSAARIASPARSQAEGRARILGADLTARRVGGHGHQQRTETEIDEETSAEHHTEPSKDPPAPGQNARLRQGLHVAAALRRRARLLARAAGAGVELGDTARGADEVQAYQVRRDHYRARRPHARY